MTKLQILQARYDRLVVGAPLRVLVALKAEINALRK
jgi:hypothetical protein